MSEKANSTKDALFECRSARPYFSVCIPQHSRYDFLLKALESIAVQSFRSFEICVSDGASPEARYPEVVSALEQWDVPFCYKWHCTQKRYDANLRCAISLASGEYCLLLGNDDAIKDTGTLQLLHDAVQSAGGAGVLIPNFEDYATGQRSARIRKDGVIGSGAETAIRHFRDFSFVSGIVLSRERAQAYSTNRWDGSEMYQTYVGCRIIANGLSLLEITASAIRKDIQIVGQQVESFATTPRVDPCPIERRLLPLRLLGQVVGDAVLANVSEVERQRLMRLLFVQLMVFTYPYWLVVYRHTQSWKYAAGIALGMTPGITLAGLSPDLRTRLAVRGAYITATTAGLTIPVGLFKRVKPLFYMLAKALSRRRRFHGLINHVRAAETTE